MSGSEHFKVADQAVFLILEDDKQSCVMNPSPSDGKEFVSTEAASSITSVGKKNKNKCSQLILKSFKMKVSKMNEHRKNHHNMWAYFFHTAKWK